MMKSKGLAVVSLICGHTRGSAGRIFVYRWHNELAVVDE